MSFLDKLFKKEVSNLTKNIFSSQTLFGGSKVWTKRDFYYGVTFSCIDAIATAVASTNLELYRIQKGDDIEIDTHPSLSLLTRPNDFQTGVDLVYQLASHIHTAGKAVLYPVRTAQGIPVELWALDPTRLQIVAGEGFVKGYVYINPMGVQVPFLPTELILIYRPNPYNAYEGVSTIEMSRRAIEADLNAQDFNSKFFENGANPSGILSTAGTLNENSFTRLRRQFEEKYEGKQNAYKTMVLEGGLSYTQVQLSQKDMDFVAQRNMSRDEIMSIFRVPKTILAITDDVNRANAETSNYVFSARTVKPMLDLIVEKLNRFYIPMFNDKTIELRFENPIPEDKEAELKYDTASVNNWETVNEVRSRHGLEPVEGGDELQAKTPDLSSLFGGGKDDKDDSKKIGRAHV